MVAIEGEIRVSDVLIELLGAKQSEEVILEVFTWEGHELYIVKVQRPVYPVDGEWLVYDQKCSIMQTFTIPPTDNLFLDMKERDTYKRYYWGFRHEGDFSVLVDVPCHQERGW